MRTLSDSERLFILIAMLSMLKKGSARRIGTVEITRRLMDEHGFEQNLRSTQRKMLDLAEVFPIEHDGHSPRGWGWSETEGQKIVEAVMEVADCIQPAAEMREFS